MPKSLFNKVAGLQACNFIKKGILQNQEHRNTEQGNTEHRRNSGGTTEHYPEHQRNTPEYQRNTNVTPVEHLGTTEPYKNEEQLWYF